MKKSVFALAAMTAAAGAAQAQSSVSVYGIIDAGYKSVNSDQVAVSSNVARVTENKVSGITGQGSESTSRFGFRGTEDIGGGLKANFAFEVGMDPAVSTLTPMNTRQAFVGVEKAGIGRLDFGTQYTPHHLTMARFSPSTLPNVPGAVDYTQSVGSNGLSQTLDKFGIIAVAPVIADQNDTFADGAAPTSTTLLGRINEMNNALITAGLGLNGTAHGTVTTAPTTAATAGVVVAQVNFATSATNAVVSGLNSTISTVNSRIAAKTTADLNTRLARGNNTSYTVRNNNVVNYQSPTINGFQAGIAYALPNQTKSTGLTAAGSNDEATSSIMMLNAGYTAGRVAVGAAYSSGVAKTVTSTAAVTASAAVTVLDGLESLAPAATDTAPTSTVSNINRPQSAARITTVEVKTTELMGATSYDFGPAKVSYIYTKRAAKDTVSDLSEKTVHNFGVKAPFGATTAFASYTVGNQTILGGTANQNKFDLRGIQTGVSYALSKRTDAYAIYGTQIMDNKATAIDMKDTGYAVGVRHTF
jgi:predicted porin